MRERSGEGQKEKGRTETGVVMVDEERTVCGREGNSQTATWRHNYDNSTCSYISTPSTHLFCHPTCLNQTQRSKYSDSLSQSTDVKFKCSKRKGVYQHAVYSTVLPFSLKPPSVVHFESYAHRFGRTEMAETAITVDRHRVQAFSNPKRTLTVLKT